MARATRVLVALALVALWVGAAAAAATSRPFGQAEEFGAFLRAAQNDDGSFGDGSLRDTARAVAALAGLAETVPRPTQVCALAAAGLAEAAGAEQLHHAAALAAALDCAGAPPAAAAAALRAMLQDEEAAVEELHHAASAAALLVPRGLDLRLALLGPLVARLEERFEADGTLANAAGSPPTLLHAGLAFQTAGLAAAHARLDEEAQDLLGVLAEHADGLLQAYAELPAGVAYVDLGDSRTAPRVTVELLRGALALQAAGGYAFDAEFVAELAEFFVAPVARPSLERVHYTLTGLHLLAGSALPAPVAVQLLQPSLSAAGGEAVRVRVADLFGAPLGPLRVYALAATAAASGRVLASNQELQQAPASETDYELPLLAARPEAGYYELELGVRAPDGTQLAAGALRTLKVLARVAVDGLRLQVLDSADHEQAQAFELAAGERLAAGVATNYYYSLAFSFAVKGAASGRPVPVQQAAVRLAGPGGEAVFAAQPDGKRMRAVVDLRAAAALLGFRSGAYAATLLVGDAFVENPLAWELGSVEIEFPARAAAAPAARRPLPELAHTFRAPERRPPAVVSLAYAAATATPWALLLLGVSMVGVDTRAPASFLFTVAFLAAVAATFVLYAGFFLAFNMFQTLGYLCGLSLVAILAGNRALRARAERRLAERKAKAD